MPNFGLFTQMLERSSPILSKIPAHRVNRQLYEGTLSRKAFRFYLEQDELYLRDFARALKLTSKRLTSERHAQQFRQFSDDTIKTERKLHLKYLGGLSPLAFFSHNKDATRKKIPVIADYTEHLLHKAEIASIEEAVASLIPCFWIYSELGKQMNLSSCNPNNPYRNWIASYSSVRFTSSTAAIIQIADELSSAIACSQQQEKIILSFLKSAEFELKFFDAILAGEQSHMPTHGEISAGYW